eukprot:272105_1
MMKMKHNRDVDNGQNPYSSADSSVSYLKRDSYMENGGQVVSKRDDVRRSEINLIISVGGIYGCYLLSGLLQEDIYVYRAENGGRFIYTFFLLWIQCIVNVCFSYVSSKIVGPSGEPISLKLFGLVGTAYISAMCCSMEALKYVNFPTKELGKSCKMIPVMLFGVLFAHKRYSLREYICVALITIGILIFNLSGSHSKGKGNNSVYGLALLCVSLIMDGVTGSTQENIKRASKHTMHEMMLYTNSFALAILTPMVILLDQFNSGMVFCMNNRHVAMDVAGFAIAAAIGQYFIYFTINHFNALVTTTITTTRKLFTILCSVVFFGHPLNLFQWMGVLLVFGGIGANMAGKYKKRHTF